MNCPNCGGVTITLRVLSPWPRTVSVCGSCAWMGEFS